MTILLPNGQPWDGTPVDGKARIVQKAATGVGVGFFNTAQPLESLNRTPQAVMKRAQLAYHLNPWIGTAEDVVTDKVTGLPWHLEDQDDEEYPEDKTAIPEVQQVRQLIELPQAILPPGTTERPGTKSKRLMWGITSRHLGLCGMAHWFGDRMDLRGTPLAWLYINPARMWAFSDERGNLTGWMLDAVGTDSNGNPYGGTPLELTEVLTFYLAAPDNGHYARGIYERAFAKARTSELADNHSSYVLGTGGRIAGIVSPKEGGSIPDEQFKVLVQEFRNVNEAPDAAKRTTIVQGPIDFTPTAADPTELDLVELSKLTRDDIFTIWRVPGSQAPIAGAMGLNSGETKGYDEAILMQGPVHARVQAMKETLQFGWLDKYKPLIIELEIVEPEYDDDTPAYDRLSKAVSVPLTNAQRWEIIGLPPTGDPAIDNAILLPATMTLWATAPAEGEKTGTIEADMEPDPIVTLDPSVPFQQPSPPAKANRRTEFLGLRKSLDQRFVPAVRTSVGSALQAQKDAVVAWIRSHEAHLVKKPTDMTWWNETKEDERLSRALTPHVASIGQVVTTRAKEVLARPGKAGFEDEVEAQLVTSAGKRIKGINEYTRTQIANAIRVGFEQGLSPAEVADLLSASTLFDEARAEVIARTETMFAYNAAAIDSYREFGVEQVQALDGDGDPECAERDMQVYTLDEAMAIEDHPNGTLDWAPYFGEGKAHTPTEPPVAVPHPPAAPSPIDVVALVKAVLEMARPEPAPINVTVQNTDSRPMREIVDKDAVTGKVIGSHFEPMVPVDG